MDRKLEFAVGLLTDGRGGPQLVRAADLRLGDKVAVRWLGGATVVWAVTSLVVVGDDVVEVSGKDGRAFTTGEGNLVLSLGQEVLSLGQEVLGDGSVR